MPHESKTAIYASIGANVVIATTKFVAAAISGSSAMLAEGVHSSVDACDGLLLLLGRVRSRRPADDRHPFGHGKELYFWTLVVAVVFFGVGGGLSVYEGLHHVLHPEPIRDPTWSYAVLGVAVLFDGSSFGIALRRFREATGAGGAREIWRAMRESKDPSLFSVLCEDSADLLGIALAFAGVYLGHRLGSPYPDGIASIAVGLVLACVAVFLMAQSKRLLIGEEAESRVQRGIRVTARREPGVRSVHAPLTMQLGPGSVLVGLDVELDPALDATQMTEAVDRLERHIRECEPSVRHIFVEPRAFRTRAFQPSAVRPGGDPAAS